VAQASLVNQAQDALQIDLNHSLTPNVSRDRHSSNNQTAIRRINHDNSRRKIMIPKSLLRIFAVMIICGGATFVQGQVGGVSPFVDCVTFNPATNQMTAYFGYTNLASSAALSNAAGSSTNFMVPGPQDSGQPSIFQRGTYHFVFSKTISTSPVRDIVWILDADIAIAGSHSARCVGQNFTYQGRLTESNASASGAFDFQFRLFDAESGSTQIGSTQTLSAVNVSSGIFTVGLDFGLNSFTSARRFLEIAVKRPADASYTTLSPRQALSPVPYASYSERASIAENATNAAQLNYVPGWRYIAKDANGNVTISGNLTVNGTVNGTLNAAPVSGSANYIQNTTSPQSNSNFNISGNGAIGGNLTVNGTITGNLGQSVNTVYGTGLLTVSSSTTTYTLIPNLSQTVNIPPGSVVMISTDGGIQSQGIGTDSFSVVDVAIFIDGAISGLGGQRRISILNSNSNSLLGNWSMSVSRTLSAGNHTFEVKAINAGIPNASNARVSAGPGLLQGQLTVTVIK
jgi:hypothetical protein